MSIFTRIRYSFHPLFPVLLDNGKPRKNVADKGRFLPLGFMVPWGLVGTYLGLGWAIAGALVQVSAMTAYLVLGWMEG